MKINWNKKYTSYAIYACMICAAVIFLIFLGINIGAVWDWLVSVFDVFAPIIYGCGIAYLLSPLLNVIEKRIFKFIRLPNWRRGASVALTFLLVLSVFVLLMLAVVPQITRSFNDLQTTLSSSSGSLQDWLDEFSQQSGLTASLVSLLTQYIDFSQLDQSTTKLIGWLYELLKKSSPVVLAFFSSFMVQMKNIIIGFIFAGYLLSTKELVFAQLKKLGHVFFKKEKLVRFGAVLSSVDKTFGKYLLGTFVDALFVGVLTAIGLLIFGMPYVPLISVLVACTNVIPFFGPFIGGIPSFLFIFISDPIKAIWFAVMILVIQQIDGNIVAPRILGNTTGIPPILVLTAITVIGGFFGFIGMVLGVPIMALFINWFNTKTAKKENAKLKPAEEPFQITFSELSPEDGSVLSSADGEASVSGSADGETYASVNEAEEEKTGVPTPKQ